MDEKEVKRLLERAAEKDIQGNVDLWPILLEQLRHSSTGPERSWWQALLLPLRRATGLAFAALALLVALTLFAVWSATLRNNSLVAQGTPSFSTEGALTAADEGPVMGTLGKPVDIGAVSVIVTGVQRADLETVVGFRVTAQSGAVEQVELPRLHLGGNMVKGRLLEGSPTSEAVAMVYPPLPASASVITFTVGPLMVPTGEPITLALEVEAIRNGGQQIQVGENRLWFHGIESMDDGGFRLLVSPVGLADSDFRLIGPGVRVGLDNGEVAIHDEDGRTYTYGGHAVQYNEGRVQAYEIRVREPLADNSAQLIISVPQGGKIVAPTTLWLALPEDNERTETEPGAIPTNPTPNLVSSAGYFSIWMPAELERDGEIEELELAGALVSCQIFFARENGAYWLVRTCDLPEAPFDELSADEIIDAAQTLLVGEASGRVIAETPITIGAHPGRRIIADSALRGASFDGTYKAHVYIVEDRLYLVSTYVFNENYNNRLELMDPFLNSFQLLEEEQPMPVLPTPPPFCNPEDVPPGGPSSLVLGAPENQRYWGNIRVTMMDTDVFPERVAHGVSLPDVQSELFERAIAALRDPERNMEQLPYASLGHYTYSDDEPCRRPDPSVQGYIVIEIWDRQVNVGYGGDGNLYLDRATNALQRELKSLP